MSKKSSKVTMAVQDCALLAAKLQPVLVQIGGQTVTANPKAYDPAKSVGWFASGKVTVDIDGVPTVCQFGGNLTVIGTKQGE